MGRKKGWKTPQHDGINLVDHFPFTAADRVRNWLSWVPLISPVISFPRRTSTSFIFSRARFIADDRFRIILSLSLSLLPALYMYGQKDGPYLEEASILGHAPF